MENDILSLRERGFPQQKEIKINELQKQLVQLQGDKPFEPLGWPKQISKQPRFR